MNSLLQISLKSALSSESFCVTPVLLTQLGSELALQPARETSFYSNLLAMRISFLRSILLPAAALMRVKCIAQTITDKVNRKDGQEYK